MYWYESVMTAKYGKLLVHNIHRSFYLNSFFLLLRRLKVDRWVNSKNVGKSTSTIYYIIENDVEVQCKDGQLFQPHLIEWLFDLWRNSFFINLSEVDDDWRRSFRQWGTINVEKKRIWRATWNFKISVSLLNLSSSLCKIKNINA